LNGFFERKQLTTDIRISPLTTQKDLLSLLRRIKQNTRLPDLKYWRLGLLHKHLIDTSAFHGFTPGDIARATGSKPRLGKAAREASERELDQADNILTELMKEGLDYPTAERKAMRRVIKKRSKEPKQVPRIRMKANRALRDLLDLLNKPNI